MSWRTIAQPIIAKVLKETSGKPEPEIRKALFGTGDKRPRKADADRLAEWERLYGRRAVDVCEKTT